MTQTTRVIAFLRSHPGAMCAVCGEMFPSRGRRGAHERWVHPDWSATPELRTARAQESREAWLGRHSKSALFLQYSNRDARLLGQPELPLDTALVDGPCVYCGGEASGWDHVVALSKGGPHTASNLVPACWPCNKRKQDTDVALFSVPSRITILCSWCWTPITRRRDFLIATTAYPTCSQSHKNAVVRWRGLPFGDPLFAGPRTRLEPVA